MNSNNKIIISISLVTFCVIFSSFYINRKLERSLTKNRKDTIQLLSNIAHYIDISNEIVGKDQISSFKLGEKNILVYRFSEDMCDGCVLQDLAELYEMQKNVGENKVLVLPSYEDTRDNRILLTNKLSNFRFVNLSEDSLSFPYNQNTGLNQRFFAYVNDKGEMTSFYFPTRNHQCITRFYLNYLKEKIENCK